MTETPQELRSMLMKGIFACFNGFIVPENNRRTTYLIKKIMDKIRAILILFILIKAPSTTYGRISITRLPSSNYNATLPLGQPTVKTDWYNATHLGHYSDPNSYFTLNRAGSGTGSSQNVIGIEFQNIGRQTNSPLLNAFPSNPLPGSIRFRLILHPSPSLAIGQSEPYMASFRVYRSNGTHISTGYIVNGTITKTEPVRATTTTLRRRFNPKSGKVEVIKNGVISRRGFFNFQSKNSNPRINLRNYR